MRKSSSGLRIIAGKHKGRRVKTIDAPGTRPMTDRVRENLFNILSFELPGATFLDLFSGSGAVGLEALSRGAEHCTFVEWDKGWFKVVQENIRFLQEDECTEAFCADAYKTVERLGTEDRNFDLIFVGAPYDGTHQNKMLAAVIEHGICGESGTIILQYRSSDPLDAAPGYQIDTRTYGITNLSFVRKE